MNYKVITYNPYKETEFFTIKAAKQFMFNYAYENDIDVGSLNTIRKNTIDFQISYKGIPQIRFEGNNKQVSL